MQFYSYLWLDAADRPYYVGKGQGRRAYKRVRGHQPPSDISRIVLFSQDSESDAFVSERALIDLFGRHDLGTGYLMNRTSGGQGTSGRPFSEESRKKIACASKRTQSGRKHSAEHIKKVAAANRGKKRSPEHIAILANWHRTHPQTPEWKAKVKAAGGGKHAA